MWQIISLCEDRMFFDIINFYRPCKRIVKIRGVEHKIDGYEAIPLDEISERNRMCIDEIEIKKICGNDEIWYKLANRDKAYDLFMKCYKILIPEENGEEMNWKETAEIIRGNAGSPVIAPRDGKAPKNVIEAI